MSTLAVQVALIYFHALWGPHTWVLGRANGRDPERGAENSSRGLSSKKVGPEIKKPEGGRCSQVCVCWGERGVLSFPTQFLSLPLGLLDDGWELVGLPLSTEVGCVCDFHQGPGILLILLLPWLALT